MDNLCAIRTLYRALNEYETAFAEVNGLDLNEAMLLCMLQDEAPLSAGDIAERLDLSCSSTSKLIRAVEQKELIARRLDPADRRRMYFTLSASGRRRVKKMRNKELPVPEALHVLLK